VEAKRTAKGSEADKRSEEGRLAAEMEISTISGGGWAMADVLKHKQAKCREMLSMTVGYSTRTEQQTRTENFLGTTQDFAHVRQSAPPSRH
jgi:hypothetical protein